MTGNLTNERAVQEEVSWLVYIICTNFSLHYLYYFYIIYIIYTIIYTIYTISKPAN